MKEYNNKRISELSWIQRGGVAIHYFEPETIEELTTLVSSFYEKHEQFDLVGLTSNIYFKNSYNVDNLISTKRLTHIKESDSIIYVECGTNVAKLSRDMVENGIKGFEGLIDLPGTVGGAIYGNSGCYGCHLSDMLVTADVLLPNGAIEVLNKEDFGFGWRKSVFKTGKIKGVVLGVNLRKEAGDREELRREAYKNKEDRKRNQPGPKYNLGTTYCSLGSRTLLGRVIGLLGGFYYRVLRWRALSEKERRDKRYQFELTLAGGHNALPYLFHIQRFMWLDIDADKAFLEYQKAMKRLYVNPALEIEIRQ